MKDVDGYEQYYSVTECGKVWSKRRKRFMRPSMGAGGRYELICLCKNGKTKGFLVHRLVAIAYITNHENKLEVNHIDGDRKNNHRSNLEWCTRRENVMHAIKIGLCDPKVSGKKTWFKKGFDERRAKNSRMKLFDKDVVDIRKRYEAGEKFSSISKDYDVDQSNIRRACKRESFSYIV